MSTLQEISCNPTFSHKSPKTNSIFNGYTEMTEGQPIILNNSPNTTAKMDLEENPTHFLELNNSNYDSDIKLIKVKIIVPKGTLTNSKFDHKSNVLTVMNDIDKITFNVHATTEYSSEVLKITNILNSADETKRPESYSNCRPKNNYPIMGRNALLVKTSTVRNTALPKTEEQLLTDSDIIQELVNERYQDSMIELYQRNFNRQTSRRSSLQTNSRTISEDSMHRDLDYNFAVNNIKHSSTMLNEVQELTAEKLQDFEPTNLEYCSVIDTMEDFESIKVVDPRQHLIQSTETVFSASSSFSIDKSACGDTFNSSDFNVDITLGSAIDFILSTDGNRLETNVQDSKNSVSVNSNATPKSRSDFDEDKFLQRALGEELHGYVSTDSCIELDKGRVVGSSETDTNDTSYVSSTSRSVNSSDISLLLSKACSLYSTVSSKIRYLSKRLPQHTSEGAISEVVDGKAHETMTTNRAASQERLAKLMQDSVVQYQVMMQTAKALGYCRSVKEFVGGLEEVEAERMLLLATCKRQNILDIIRKCEYEDHAEDEENSVGKLTLSNFVFHPKEYNYSIAGKKKPAADRLDYSNQWFVCIVHCNEVTYASEAKMVEKDGFVKFGDEVFGFKDLGMDFELNVMLYAIKLKNGLRSYSHESKFHLKQDTKTNSTLCPPAPSTSFFQHLTLTRSPPPTANNPPSTKHSFIPFGTCTLRLNHLTHNSSGSEQSNCYRLGKMPTVGSNQFSGVFSMDVGTETNVRAKGAGFMTIGTADPANKVTCWSRHWCELDGSELRWWNYPQDGSAERTEALGSIDLGCCISARITSVDRDICARPRTLLLETSCDKVTRHLLSFDSADEVKVWEKKLNTVLGILRSWNAMKTRNKVYKNKIE